MLKKIFIAIASITMAATAFCREIESYSVTFEGALPPHVVEQLNEHSQLQALQQHPPATLAGLKRRAESDLPTLVQVMHSFAYYNAHISFDYQQQGATVDIIVAIDAGPVYPLESLLIFGAPAQEHHIGEAALPKTLRTIEKEVLQELNSKGHPFARITEQEVVADQESQTVTLSLKVDAGPLANFGDITIQGNRTVKAHYFNKRLAWCWGERYNPELMECTKRALERGQLFSSVEIDHGDTLEGDTLPMVITLHERNMRSVALGINYASQRGPGFSGEWQHRNFWGMGEQLTARANMWHDEQLVKLSYLQPDFFGERRNLEWLAEYYREKTEGYTTRSVSFGALVTEPHCTYGQIAYGPKYVFLHDSDIHEEVDHQAREDSNERFHLLKFPYSYSWNCSDNLLDPTRGYRYKIHMEPSYQLHQSQFIYSINTFTLSRYWAINRNLIFAWAAHLGSIIGPKKTTIPRSELFDAGTDTLLRGYRYKSVSPLDKDNDPTGGRSMMIYSVELRWKMNKDIGWVVFYDFGNVYSSTLPKLDHNVLQSTGIGFRYYTPVGPIRLDLAFPLTPRKHVDKSSYQAYLSIGQTF